jgi:hypothetical protein
MGRGKCSHEGCKKPAAGGGTQHCKLHGGGRRCDLEGCFKWAQGGTPQCVAHGGGRRCQHEGCAKSARGENQYCAAHGGSRRCQHEGCSSSAPEGGTLHCVVHGGGRRCQYGGCSKATHETTSYCAGHGGGRRCQQEGCSKAAVIGGMDCVAHGGVTRCQQEDCSKPVDQAPGSVYCTLCLQLAQPQPDGAEAPQASAADLALSASEREAIRTLVENFSSTSSRPKRGTARRIYKDEELTIHASIAMTPPHAACGARGQPPPPLAVLSSRPAISTPSSGEQAKVCVEPRVGFSSSSAWRVWGHPLLE